jgi:hypothetical protein
VDLIGLYGVFEAAFDSLVFGEVATDLKASSKEDRRRLRILGESVFNVSFGSKDSYAPGLTKSLNGRFSLFKCETVLMLSALY